jgi:DNA polymerase-3 subunit beta
MRALCDREVLLTAFGMVSGVVSTRSLKPVLQNIQFIADVNDRSVLIGTDLDVGIRYHVLGIKVEKPGTVVLPTVQISSILRTSPDAELTIETE